jgi:8-oxo-dGTP pyrophosphatase MutT (NUDIX family)
MIREAAEEAGIKITLDNLKVVQVMHRRKLDEERIDYFFECKKWCGDVVITEPDKCDKMDWVYIDRLPDNTIDYIREAVKNYKDDIPFSIYGW